MKASWVILSRGDRPAQLRRAVESAAEQTVPLAILVVANGADLVPPPPARVLVLPRDVGVPAGRNAGICQTDGDVVLFLDDDAVCATDDLVEQVLVAFGADERLGIVSFRITDPSTGVTPRHHVPRLRIGDPRRSSEVTTFLGGACAVRRALLDQAGLYPDAFGYAMEESDLAWRALDAGWRIEYRGDLVVYHSAEPPARHPEALRHTARNRVWLARRRLPAPLVPAYLAVWCMLSLVRSRSLADARETLRGFAEGFRTPCGERRPIRWRTALRMARLGRPPVV